MTGAAGFRFPTRMAVIRLPGQGGLWNWSPVALTEDIRKAVDRLGPVRHLVASNTLHHTFVGHANFSRGGKLGCFGDQGPQSTLDPGTLRCQRRDDDAGG